MKQRMIIPMLAVCLFCFSFTSIPSNKQSKGATSTFIDISGEYNPMCGETILVTGKLHIVEQTTTNRNKTRVMLMGNYQGVSGIGTESGQRYQITFSQKNVTTVDLASGGQKMSVSFSENLVSPGKGMISFAVNGYYEFNANGTIVAQDFDIVFCQ